jgi:hypothetical protein
VPANVNGSPGSRLPQMVNRPTEGARELRPGIWIGPQVGGAVTQTLGFSALPVIPLVAGATTVGTLAWAGRRRTREA